MAWCGAAWCGAARRCVVWRGVVVWRCVAAAREGLPPHVTPQGRRRRRADPSDTVQYGDVPTDTGVIRHTYAIYMHTHTHTLVQTESLAKKKQPTWLQVRVAFCDTQTQVPNQCGNLANISEMVDIFGLNSNIIIFSFRFVF